jgi:hypothetical protein
VAAARTGGAIHERKVGRLGEVDDYWRRKDAGRRTGGVWGGDSATVFNITDWAEKTSRAAPSIERETSRLRDDGLMRSEVVVPHSGILGRRTFERGFEPGIIRRAKICFFGFVCGRCGALPGRKGLRVLGLELRKTDTT